MRIRLVTCAAGAVAVLVGCSDVELQSARQAATFGNDAGMSGPDGYMPPPPLDGYMPPPDGYMPPPPPDASPLSPDGYTPPQDAYTPPQDAHVPPPDGGLPTPTCFGDVLVVAEQFESIIRQDVLSGCSSYTVPDPGTPPSDPTQPSDEPDSETLGEIGDNGTTPAGETPEPPETGDPTNCGYTDAAIEAHTAAVAALANFQLSFRHYLETASVVYAYGQFYQTDQLLTCLDELQAPVLAEPGDPPPEPACTPAGTDYNCKGVVDGQTTSYWNGPLWGSRTDSARGTTCTDTIWNTGFFWERFNYAPWQNARGRRAQILARAWAANRDNFWAWETHTSCKRETESIRTKFRLMIEPRATIVPRWIYDPRTSTWVANNQNWAWFRNAGGDRCSSDCLAAGEGARQFKVGASVRPKLSAIFGGLAQSRQRPDGHYSWGNNEYNYLSQVLGTLHCFGPGTLYTAQETFTTLPSDVPMPFDAQIAPDCQETTNASVNGSISYAQQGQQGTFTLGVGGAAGQQSVCKKNAGAEIRLSVSCNMAEGAGFANFRSAGIDMPAHARNCRTNGTCAWQGMQIGGQQPANKLDLGYWFEQLAAIGRASPNDGNNWSHGRYGYAHFRRGGWQHDPTSPDWPGSWTNHRHAWEGNACKVYRVTNPAQGTLEALGEDKAICVFSGQTVVDPPATPGAPTVNPNVMILPYDNAHADWDPELGRPAGVECTQNAQCASASCVAGVCQ